MNWKEFLTGYKGKEIPKELNEFNWGAFLLTFIWGIPHKAWITLLAIPLIWIQLPLGLNWILFTILQFYAGFKGNMWAYQQDWWMSPKDFRMKQTSWAIVAITINICIPIIVISTLARFVHKSPDNPANFIKNTQCTVAYSNLKKGFPKIDITNQTSTNQMARDFASNFKNAKAQDNSTIFTQKSEGKNVDVYEISFSQIEENSNCNILKQNCYIESNFILPSEIRFANHCKFYFDNNKTIKPDEETSNALEKGFNIFKYL